MSGSTLRSRQKRRKSSVDACGLDMSYRDTTNGDSSASSYASSSGGFSDARSERSVSPGWSHMIQPNLSSMPTEILEHIAFELVQETPYAAPKDLLGFFLLSKRFNYLLAPGFNNRLYARLFKAKFDTDAIGRRFGRDALRASILAEEYKKRTVALTRLRLLGQEGLLYPVGDAAGVQQMTQDLWTAYLMVLEHDTKNVDQLRQHARLLRYLEIYYAHYLLSAAVKPGYPPETTDRSLALHLSYLLTTKAELDQEPQDEAEAKFFVLKPYVFAAHKFTAYYAPWTLPTLPINPNRQGVTKDRSSSQRPVIVPGARGEVLRYLSQDLYIAPPLLFQAACMSFFLRVERDPGASGQNDNMAFVGPRMQTHQPAANFPGPGALTQHAGLSLRAPETPMARLQSEIHDRDFKRLLSCGSPFRIESGLHVAHFRGEFQGTWEGTFNFFDFDSYREMLSGRVRSLYEGPFRSQPQVWRIDETIIRLPSGSREGGEGVILNAGYGESQRTTFGGVRIGLDAPHFSANSAKQRMLSSLGKSEEELEEVIVRDGQDLRADENYEILLSGTGHSAWGQFVLQGRVRSWDGLFSLTKEYTPDGRGRWLYRGYVSPGGPSLVGRWRDTFTPPELNGYEGTFLMSKRGAD